MNDFKYQTIKQRMINDLIFDIAILQYEIEIQIEKDFNWFKLQPLQEELCLKEYYLKSIRLDKMNLVPYAKFYL